MLVLVVVLSCFASPLYLCEDAAMKVWRLAAELPHSIYKTCRHLSPNDCGIVYNLFFVLHLNTFRPAEHELILTFSLLRLLIVLLEN